MEGFVKKSVIKTWLQYLINQPLYKLYKIKIDENFFKNMENNYHVDFTATEETAEELVNNQMQIDNVHEEINTAHQEANEELLNNCMETDNINQETHTVQQESTKVLNNQLQADNINIESNTVHRERNEELLNNHTQADNINQELPERETARIYDVNARTVFRINELSEHIPMEESLIAQQQTLLWNEDKFLQIAPGQHQVPKSLLFDTHAEELSFPSIYLGQGRNFDEALHVTPFMMATSELRRSDRRGAGPNKLLYVAAKIMRFRVNNSLKISFKHIGKNTNISKEEIMSAEYINNCIDKNLAFLKNAAATRQTDNVFDYECK